MPETPIYSLILLCTVMHAFNLRTLAGEASRFCEFGASLVYIMGSGPSIPHCEIVSKTKTNKQTNTHSFHRSTVDSCWVPDRGKAFPEALMYGEAT